MGIDRALPAASEENRTTVQGGPRGYDAGKKIKGRKRHIVTDTTGLMVGIKVHEANIQDRDGAVDVLTSIRAAFPWLRHIFADGGKPGQAFKSYKSLCPVCTLLYLRQG